MLEMLKNLFGFGPRADFAELVRQGALIIDVRTKGEYDGGHIKGSVNIPVQILGKNIKNLKDKNRPIITCCASGARSGAAKKMLIAAGFTNVHNGGSWGVLRDKIGM